MRKGAGRSRRPLLHRDHPMIGTAGADALTPATMARVRQYAPAGEFVFRQTSSPAVENLEDGGAVGRCRCGKCHCTSPLVMQESPTLKILSGT